MAIEVRMPDLGTAVDEIRVLKWLVPEGAPVKRGDLLVEIETDKAASELESVAEGFVLKHAVPEGTTVKNGDIIAYVGEPGEVIAAPQPRVSPMVSNLAKKLGVDLSAVSGTGSGGMITREDVMKANPPSKAQTAVARAVEKSTAEIPHLRVLAAIDMTAVEELRTQKKIGYDAIFLRAMALAAGSKGVHLGLAIGFENELRLPVIRDVEQKDLDTLQAEIAAIAASARDGSLKLDTTEGSMSLSNLGMFPVECFDAIIFPGQTEILAVGAVQKKPVVVNDQIVIRPMVTVTLSADHRTVNGRAAAEFLTKVKHLVESLQL